MILPARATSPAAGPPSRLRFGTSGIPRSSRRPRTDDGIRRLAELGLDCLELAWGNGIRMTDATVARIAAAARETGIELTAHAPYYVNLCGDRDTIARSVRRLIDAGTLASRCGATSFCFHAGFQLGQDRHHAQVRVWRSLLAVVAGLRDRGITIDVRPELTGRVSQLGSFEEIVLWCEMIPGVHPCIDFSHHYARLEGAANAYDDFLGMLDLLAERLGPAALSRLHVHLGGIEYGAGGERRHTALRDSAFRWQEVLEALRDRGVSGWVVCESPALEDDALSLKQRWQAAA